MTDRNEALRLAEWLRQNSSGIYRPAADAAYLLDKQAERIAELEGEIANLHTTMFAAAVEIQAHWEAHCDAEGYGPANLMHRLERGIASQYGYDAKTLQRVEAERDQLKTDLHIATDDAAQMLASTQSLRSERDQLRAEVETLKVALRMGAEAEVARAHEVVGLRAEVERLRVDAERWTALRASNFQMVMHSKGKRVFWSVRPVFTNYEYSLFDSQDQAVDSLRNEQKEQP